MISKKDMKQYRYILMETPDIENRIKRSQKRLEKLESEGNVVDKVSGGEGGNQHFRIEGFPVAEYSREKTRLMTQMLRHEQNMEFLAKIKKEACEFIDSIPEPRARMIFRFYFEDGMTQQQIAMKVHIDQKTVSNDLNKYLNKLS